jgi:hypothetical protein
MNVTFKVILEVCIKIMVETCINLMGQKMPAWRFKTRTKEIKNNVKRIGKSLRRVKVICGRANSGPC